MIKLKTPGEIEKMRKAGKITAAALNLAGELIAVGVTTQKIDKAVQHFIVSQGATPTFLGYGGFPASICVSVNDEIIHGIPGVRKLKDGDVVSIDVGATYDGYVGDCAATFIVGDGTEEARHLVDVTRESFYAGLQQARAGNRISDISRAVQEYAEKNGCSVVREYVGHGVGRDMHEAPEVPNFIANPRRGGDPRLVRGMTIAIEPMVNLGGQAIRQLADKWTIVTRDGSLSAHYENTVLITDGQPEILTPHNVGVAVSVAANSEGV
ncbi:MAG: type I methionyl aminopeptidase [Oscillospiraceae bacterium]|jgi:methionyl aminopeptidase|nr:type I methionyl aminopeptidase [Oscillospiraceae bacterium]